jgi:rare lipoprotein A
MFKFRRFFAGRICQLGSPEIERKIMKVSIIIVALTALAASFTSVAQTSTPASKPITAATPITAPVRETSAVAAAVSTAVATPPSKISGNDQMQGTAAYYSNRFNGRRTASGQRFSNSAMTAAHNTLPFGTRVKVTNVKNKRSVVVRINDRGPSTPGRVFDLTRAAASKLGYVRTGMAEVTAEVVSGAPAKSARSMKK